MQIFTQLGKKLVVMVVAGCVVMVVAGCLAAMPPTLVAQVRKAAAEPNSAVKELHEVTGLPRITLLSLQVVKPEPAPENMPPAVAQFRVRGQYEPPQGTTLIFLLEQPHRMIQSIESTDCRITRFTDDKGIDLLGGNAAPEGDDRPPPPRPRGFPGNQPFDIPISAQLDPGGHRAKIYVHSPHLPASGASKVFLEANLVLKYHRGDKTFEQKNVNVKLDKVTAGPVPLLIVTDLDAAARMKHQPDVPGFTQVIVFHQGSALDVQKLAFIGPDGNPIQATLSGGGSSGSMHQTYYRLAGKVETCTIRVSVPEVETATLAITVNTGLGFPPGVRRGFISAPAADGSEKNDIP